MSGGWERKVSKGSRGSRLMLRRKQVQNGGKSTCIPGKRYFYSVFMVPVSFLPSEVWEWLAWKTPCCTPSDGKHNNVNTPIHHLSFPHVPFSYL